MKILKVYSFDIILKQFNAYKFYLSVAFLPELYNLKGTQLLQGVLFGDTSNSPTSTLRWIIYPKLYAAS